jgi:hypothetical protein
MMHIILKDGIQEKKIYQKCARGRKVKKIYSNEKRSFNLPIEASIKVTQV